MTARPVRAVLLGYGYWGRRLLGIAGRVDELRVVGVVDDRAGAADFRPPESLPCHADLDRALGDDSVEAVIVTVPAAYHAAVVERSLSTGKHVFVEKPLAVRAADARALISLAHDRGLMLTVDHQYWWSPEIAALSAVLEAGEAGRIVAVSAQRAAPGPVRQDVSAWWDLASHDISTLVRAGVLRPDDAPEFRVRRCTAIADGDVDGCVAVSVSGPAGIEMWVHACWMSSIQRRRLVVTGEAGSLCLEEDAGALSLWLDRDRERRLLSQTAKGDQGNRRTPVECALSAFAEGVRGVPDLCAATDAVSVVSIMEQIADGARAEPRAVVPAGGCWL